MQPRYDFHAMLILMSGCHYYQLHCHLTIDVEWIGVITASIS